jgi:hypothetical protein
MNSQIEAGLRVALGKVQDTDSHYESSAICTVALHLPSLAGDNALLQSEVGQLTDGDHSLSGHRQSFLAGFVIQRNAQLWREYAESLFAVLGSISGVMDRK